MFIELPVAFLYFSFCLCEFSCGVCRERHLRRCPDVFSLLSAPPTGLAAVVWHVSTTPQRRNSAHLYFGNVLGGFVNVLGVARRNLPR